MEKEIEHNMNILEWKGKIELQGKRSEKLHFLFSIWILKPTRLSVGVGANRKKMDLMFMYSVNESE